MKKKFQANNMLKQSKEMLSVARNALNDNEGVYEDNTSDDTKIVLASSSSPEQQQSMAVVPFGQDQNKMYNRNLLSPNIPYRRVVRCVRASLLLFIVGFFFFFFVISASGKLLILVIPQITHLLIVERLLELIPMLNIRLHPFSFIFFFFFFYKLSLPPRFSYFILFYFY
jgi:hypothetical protein